MTQNLLQFLTQDLWSLRSIDLLWLIVAPLMVYKGQKLKALAFVLVCVLTLRLQVEIVQSTGFAQGFTGLWDMVLLVRGQIIYSLFIFVFLVLSFYSPATKGAIYLAACLSIFFMAFFVSSLALLI
jgi:hypothetical protein